LDPNCSKSNPIVGLPIFIKIGRSCQFCIQISWQQCHLDSGLCEGRFLFSTSESVFVRLLMQNYCFEKVKSLKGGKEMRMDVLVMENLLFERNVTTLYDLKGSARSRYNPDSNGSDKVLLDQNLIEAMPTSPIFVGNKAKRLLERAVWNDTSFLAVSINHMLTYLSCFIPLDLMVNPYVCC